MIFVNAVTSQLKYLQQSVSDLEVELDITWDSITSQYDSSFSGMAIHSDEGYWLILLIL